MLDKPKFTLPGASDLGIVDIKFNHLGNRIAVTSVESTLRIFNIHPETGMTLYKEISAPNSFDLWKVDFNPNGNEILTGTLSLSTYDISSGDKVNEFN